MITFWGHVKETSCTRIVFSVPRGVVVWVYQVVVGCTNKPSGCQSSLSVPRAVVGCTNRHTSNSVLAQPKTVTPYCQQVYRSGLGYDHRVYNYIQGEELLCEAETIGTFQTCPAYSIRFHQPCLLRTEGNSHLSKLFSQ